MIQKYKQKPGSGLRQDGIAVKNTVLNISLSSHRKTLSNIDGLPFTVATQQPFNLARKLRVIELRRKPRKPSTTTHEKTPDAHDYGAIESLVSVESQIEHWKACVAACADSDEEVHGWTMCISGKNAHFGLSEYIAAKLLAVSKEAGRPALWINIGDAMRRKAYEVDALLDGADMPKLVIITGLRWDSPATKWERAMDLARSTTQSMDRVIVATGENPLVVMTKLGLPVQRVLNLGNHQVDLI